VNISGMKVKLGIVILLLVGGAVALQFSALLLGSEVDKAPAPLAHDLLLLGKQLGDQPRFMALGHDRAMEPDVLAGLGTNLYLLRDYTKLAADKTSTNDVVSLNINYYERGTATPHVPDICWAGNGLTKVYDTEILVPNVPHKDGTRSTVPMRLLSFAPRKAEGMIPGLEEKADQSRLLTVGYTFQVNGQYVGNRAQVVKLFWRRDSRFGYHCKIEITYRAYVPPEQARPVIEDFLRASLPQIEECLPDWQKLNAPTGGTTAAGVVPGH